MGNGPDTLRPRPDRAKHHPLRDRISAWVTVPAVALGGGALAVACSSGSPSADRSPASPPAATGPMTPGGKSALIDCTDGNQSPSNGQTYEGLVRVVATPQHPALFVSDRDTPIPTDGTVRFTSGDHTKTYPNTPTQAFNAEFATSGSINTARVWGECLPPSQPARSGEISSRRADIAQYFKKVRDVFVRKNGITG